MATTGDLFCAHCGKQSGEIEIDMLIPTPRIDDIAREHRWIVQYNGENTDIYCSKRCAE